VRSRFCRAAQPKNQEAPTCGVSSSFSSSLLLLLPPELVYFNSLTI
jgi:hypothetical protein